MRPLTAPAAARRPKEHKERRSDLQSEHRALPRLEGCDRRRRGRPAQRARSKYSTCQVRTAALWHASVGQNTCVPSFRETK